MNMHVSQCKNHGLTEGSLVGVPDVASDSTVKQVKCEVTHCT